ncbi:MAG TPA: cupredoxin domain-containing protein [Candidatus Saccharimonadales bacterium]
MNKKTILYLVIGAVVLAGIGIWLYIANKPTTSTKSNTTDTANTITYSDSGFSPKTITVKAGTTITLKNTSAANMQFDSDPHPVHTNDTELNIGSVAAGQSTTFTVNTPGTHGYHNHLNPSDTGTIVVQ